MSNAENARIPRQEQWPADPADPVEYGPDVPLAERLENEHKQMRLKRQAGADAVHA